MVLHHDERIGDGVRVVLGYGRPHRRGPLARLRQDDPVGHDVAEQGSALGRADRDVVAASAVVVAGEADASVAGMESGHARPGRDVCQDAPRPRA